jgi:hypothetical protein
MWWNRGLQQHFSPQRLQHPDQRLPSDVPGLFSQAAAKRGRREALSTLTYRPLEPHWQVTFGLL